MDWLTEAAGIFERNHADEFVCHDSICNTSYALYKDKCKDLLGLEAFNFMASVVDSTPGNIYPTSVFLLGLYVGAGRVASNTMYKKTHKKNCIPKTQVA